MASDSLRFVAKLTLGTVLVLILLYIGAGVLHFVWLRSVFERFTEGIASTTGLNLWLARAVAIIGVALIPALFTAVMPAFFSAARKRKQLATVVVVGVLGVGFLAMYFLTKNNVLGKCWVYDVVTGNVELRDRAGPDPATGQVCQPIDTPELAQEIRTFLAHRSGQPSSANEILFDLEGHPLYRSFRHPDGKVDLYPSFLKRHPTFNVPLELIDEKIARQWEQQQRAVAQLSATTPSEGPIRPPKPRSPRDEPLASDLGHPPSPPEVSPERFVTDKTPNSPDTLDVGVAIVDGGAPDWNTARAIADSIDDRGGCRVALLSEAFFAEGYFNRVFAGDTAPLTDNRLETYLDLVLLGTRVTEPTYSGAANIRNARASIEAQLVNVRTGEIQSSVQETDVGAGPGDVAAEQQALKRVSARIARGLF